MWTKFQISLAAVMVFTGSINTLSTKWADKMESIGADGKLRPFEHPFVQACSMFMGEILCLLTFKALYFHFKRKNDGSHDEHHLVKGNREFSKFHLFVPAMCDMIATSIMYVGLTLTFASSFQMFRGSVIIFVGLLSVAFLDRKLVGREWSGIGFVILGLIVVGFADFMSDQSGGSKSRNDLITGDLLIVTAQIITSVQMVYEEKFVAGLDIPALQAVGWEGTFGFTILGLLLIPMYFIPTGAPFNHNAHQVLEDFPDAMVQLANNKLLIVAITGTVISIAFFNFAGISVTKELSATTRMVLDSVRTVVIWMFSIIVGWQQFHFLQLVGFAFLLFGMSLYNNILGRHTIVAIRRVVRGENRGEDTEEIINREAAGDP